MNILALFTLAGVRSHVADTSSLYTFQEADGSGSMRRALDFLTQFGTNSSKKWPYTQVGPYVPGFVLFCSVLYHRYAHASCPTPTAKLPKKSM